jgi:hypothetical protein
VRGTRAVFWAYLGTVLAGVAYCVALGLLGR